jgi:hypothetical protein
MAFTCKSAGVMVMLMLAALAASAQAADERPLWVHNQTPTEAKCNGVHFKPGERKSILLVGVLLKLELLGSDGKWVPAQCDVPKDVAEVALIVKVTGEVVVKVVALLGGLIHKLLGTLLGTVLVVIKIFIKVG